MVCKPKVGLEDENRPNARTDYISLKTLYGLVNYLDDNVVDSLTMLIMLIMMM